jgi:hypothetical protein
MTKKKEESWRKSKARELLKDDIILGTILPQMEAAEVYEMRPEFKKFPFKRFGPNLQNLRLAIVRDYKRMSTDCEYYGHDVGVLMELRANDPPRKIAWHKSEAKPLLEKDIKDKMHEKIMENGSKITPAQLYKKRVEYRAFSIDVFRNHIYQEVKRLEKIESKIRYGKKKKRYPAAEVHAHVMAMIDHA